MDAYDTLVGCLGRLPGVGRRSAERMASRLVREPAGLMRELMDALAEAQRTIVPCPLCGGVTTTDRQPCALCSNPRRDATVLCVVEDPNDIAAIQRAGVFQGRYHALMGKLSPMKGEGLRHLRIPALLERLDREPIAEVLLATGTDVEGEATATYVAGLLKGRNVRVTRIALGLPAGSGIAYADPVTLKRAIGGRRKFEAEDGSEA
jgi:recombination protein RecR